MFLGFGENLLEKWNLDNEAQLFFILRWQELFDTRTYSSWRVRTSNVISILEELNVGLEMARTVPKSFASLEYLLDEALEIAKADIIIKTRYPLMSKQLSILKELFTKSKNDQLRNCDMLTRHVNSLLSQFDNYVDCIFQHVEDGLFKDVNDSQYKKDIDDLSMSLAIALSNLGFSHHFLQDALLILKEPATDSFQLRFSRLKQSTNTKRKDFTAYFPVRISLKDAIDKTIENVSFIKAKDVTGNFEPLEIGSFDKKYSNFILAKTDTTGMDEYSAYQKAAREIERALAMIRLFHFEGDAELLPEALLSSEKNIKIIDPSNSNHNYLRNPKRPLKKIEELSFVLENLQPNDQERISSVLQYHRLAMSAHTDETKLVNLWVALECLVRISGTSVISNVCGLVTPSLVTHHMHAVIKNLAIDLRDAWRDKKAAEVLHRSIGLVSDQRILDIPLDKLLGWLVQDDMELEIKCIYDKLITNNPLAVFRVDRIQQTYIKDYVQYSKVLQSHYKHIDWQIRRIYRARNLLVHWGKYSPNLEQLTQHLHSYLVLTLQNILTDLTWNRNWNISQALEYRAGLYRMICDKESSSKFLSAKVILNPALLLKSSEAHNIWNL